MDLLVPLGPSAVKFGPSSYSVRGITDVSISGASSVGPIAFRFPKAVFVTGLVMNTRRGSVSELASLQLRIQDETFQDLIATGWTGQNDAGALSLSGRLVLAPLFTTLMTVRPYVLQRPVATGDVLYFTVTNTSDEPIIPELHLLFDEAAR